MENVLLIKILVFGIALVWHYRDFYDSNLNGMYKFLGWVSISLLFTKGVLFILGVSDE